MTCLVASTSAKFKIQVPKLKIGGGARPPFFKLRGPACAPWPGSYSTA